MRGKMKQMADAMEGLAGLLRERWSGGSVGTSAGVAEVEKEGKTPVSVPEDLDSEEEDNDKVVDDEKSEEEEVEEDEDEDEDVEMDDDEPRALTARPIGIIGDPILPASSSAS